MSVVSVNPMAEELHQQSSPERSFVQRHSKKAKVLLGLGVVACVGAAGYVLGSSQTTSASPTPTASDDDDDRSGEQVAQALSRIELAFADESNIAATGELSIPMIEQLLDQYNNDPSAWNDQFLTADIMEAFKTLREEHQGHNSRRRLGRNLVAYDDELVDDMWEEIEFADYTDALKIDDDKILVKRQPEETRCIVIAEQSNSGDDYVNNANLGMDDIESIVPDTIKTEACGCKRMTFWWCSEYNTCSATKKIGKAYKGFVKPYRELRQALYERVKTTCQSTDTLVFAGYSRGAAIVSIYAFAFQQESLWPVDQMRLVTFGSPRTLDKPSSDKFHLTFPQHRIIYGNDITTSVPFNWMGFRHVGSPYCLDCDFPLERDRPFYAWNFGDHTKYCEFWGDEKCKPNTK